MGLKSTFTFRCPVCAKTFRTDEPGEPCCTGPSEMRHDHDLAVMRLVQIDRREISPIYAERRAHGPMILLEG
jgi:hypothetical protein